MSNVCLSWQQEHHTNDVIAQSGKCHVTSLALVAAEERKAREPMASARASDCHRQCKTPVASSACVDILRADACDVAVVLSSKGPMSSTEVLGSDEVSILLPESRRSRLGHRTHEYE